MPNRIREMFAQLVELLGSSAAPLMLSVIAVLVLWIVATKMGVKWRRLRHRSSVRKRRSKAHQAEIDAAGVLRAHGYSIVDDQSTLTWVVMLDDHPHEVELRADYVVQKGRRRYVAEVKSGVMAPSIDTAATRRQLLEYRLAYDVDGILLVDMEAVEIYVVGFDLTQASGGKRPSRLAWLCFGIALGVGVAKVVWHT